MGNQPGTPGYDPRYPSNYYKNYQNNTQIKSNQVNLQRANSNNGNVPSSYESPQVYNQYSQNSNTQQNNQIPQRSDSLSKKPSFVTKVQAIDKIKVGIKLTRDKVDKLIGQYENQIEDITSALNKQKQNGLNNKKKAVYLLKQRKQFQKQVQNLQTRKQVVLKTLNDLNQQHLDKQMAVILEQSNKYMKNVQDQLEKMDWRGILDDVAANNNYYNNAFALQAQQDPEVDRMFQQLEKEVLGPNYKPKQRQVQINLPAVATVEQIKLSFIKKQSQKQKYLETNQPFSSNANINKSQINHPRQKIIAQNSDKNKKQSLNVTPIMQQVTANMQSLSIQSNKMMDQNNVKQVENQKKQQQQYQKAKIQKQQQQQQKQKQKQQQQIQQQQLLQHQQYQQQLYQQKLYQQQYYQQQNQYPKNVTQQNSVNLQNQQIYNKQSQNIVAPPSEANNLIKKQSKQVLLAPTFEQQATKQNIQQPTKSINNQPPPQTRTQPQFQPQTQYQPQNNNNVYQPSQSTSQQLNQYSNNSQKQFSQNNQQQISMNQVNNQVTPFQFPTFNNKGLTVNSKMPPRPQLQQPYQQNK